MTDQLRANANLVDSLGSATRHGGSALADAPVLLKRVLEEGAWREFVTQRGDHVVYTRFSDFVTTPPLKGLGVDMALVERVVGTSDPDLLVLLREAERVGSGRSKPSESDGLIQGDSSTYTAGRLARDAPDHYSSVKTGEMSLNAAAVLAGIRPRRISVRLDSPKSIATSLRRNLPPELLAELRALLTED